MFTDGVRAQALSAPPSSACFGCFMVMKWLPQPQGSAVVCKAGKGTGQHQPISSLIREGKASLEALSGLSKCPIGQNSPCDHY